MRDYGVKPLHELSQEELEVKRSIARITTYTLSFLSRYLVERGFDWVLPVVFSKSTDPLWPDPDFSIEKRIEVEIYGETVRSTQSMIVHKQVLVSLLSPKIFVFSPNVRIETRKRASTGIHAYEFTQLDFEVRGASSSYIRSLVEDMLKSYVSSLKREMEHELSFLGSELPEIMTPFKVVDSKELEEEYGKEWQTSLRSTLKEPVWVVNIPREFYDFEDPETGRWDNYDLYVPRVGEILSGARREYEYEKILSKMKRDGVRPENYRVLLDLAREGRLLPSAGAGIGVERLLLWVTGVRHIGIVQPFPRIPGIVFDL